MSDVLERRYSRLLRCYPAAYRARFGDDLMATLLDHSHPDERWPDLRQSAALVLAGLRARAADGHASSRHVWAQGLQIAVALLLTSMAVTTTQQLLVHLTLDVPLSRTGVASALGSLLAIALLMRGRLLPAAATVWLLTAGTFGFGTLAGAHLFTAAYGDAQQSLYGPFPRYLLGALALTLLAAWLKPTQPRRSWWWLAALATIVLLPLSATAVFYADPQFGIQGIPARIQLSVTVGLVLTAALWSFIDPRAATIGIWCLLGSLLLTSNSLRSWWDGYPYPWYLEGATHTATALILLSICWYRVRRRMIHL